jgi:hypothetical protein
MMRAWPPVDDMVVLVAQAHTVTLAQVRGVGVVRAHGDVGGALIARVALR